MICRAKTTKGKQCTRKVVNSDYCWQHINENSKFVTDFFLPDDILVNCVLPLLDIKSLISFSQTCEKAQKVCDNSRFWITKFKTLPFSYEMPKTLAKIMAEYRRIHESYELAQKFVNKASDLPSDAYSCLIKGKDADSKKWFEMNLIDRIDKLDIEKIKSLCVRFVGYGMSMKSKVIVITADVNRLWECNSIYMDNSEMIYILAQAFYHIKRPKIRFYLGNTDSKYISKKELSLLLS